MRYRFGPSAPKNKNSRRTIVISDLLINQLKLYRKWWLEIKLFKGKIVSKDEYILITLTAALVDEKFFKNAFDTLLKETDFKRITSHSRNHFANE